VSVRLPGPERRRQLLETAVREFGTHGYHDTSMNRLAEAAGVTKPVLYQHFESKRDLYLQVLSDLGQELRDKIVAATVSAKDPHAKVEAGFLAYFTFFAQEPAAFTVLFGDGSRKDDEFAAVSHAVEAAVAVAIAEHITIADLSSDDRRVLAFGIVGMAEGATRFWVTDQSARDPEALARLLAEAAWFGLRGRGPGRF
jgi:AcrR family transcriptional regulator